MVSSDSVSSVQFKGHPTGCLSFPRKLQLSSLEQGYSWAQHSQQIDSRLQNSTLNVCIQAPIHHNFTRGVMLYTPPLWESIHKFHNMQYHADNYIMPGTCSKGKLWQREWIFSLRNLIFRSINPQCCEAATQSSLGAVGSCTTNSLMEANL